MIALFLELMFVVREGGSGTEMVKEISERQRDILNFIREFLNERGYPPTIRDIVEGCHISSTSVVDYNLRILEREGYLRCDRKISRGIELLGEQINKAFIKIPVLGQIAAGIPISVPDSGSWSSLGTAEMLSLPQELTGGRENIYILRVKGNSMIDALIGDGDLVVMQETKTADEGDMVAVWLKNKEEVTLKKFYHEGDRIRLQPANIQMSPIFVNPADVQIQGKVICVIRRVV
jgi:repressor LexA